MKKKIDPTLFELCLGIVLYGIAFQLVLLLFSREFSYSVGLWIGIVLAVAGAIHMWWSLNRGLDQAAKGAVKTVGANSLIRYFVLVVIMGVLVYTEFANPIFAFFGYMGMKVSAYMNPWMKKLNAWVFKIQ